MQNMFQFCENLKYLDLSSFVIKEIDKTNMRDMFIGSLNWSNNQISNIKILEKFNFKELQELNLSFNEISDIKILAKVNFKESEKLVLSDNRISDINWY